MTGTFKTLLPSYGLIAALFALILISNSSFAQEYSPLDSIKTGSKYKLILFDDTEIIGTIIRKDSEYVTINTGLAEKTVKKDDIFNISKNLIPSKYRFMFSLGGGVIFPGGEFPYGNNRDYNPSISFQLNSAFVLSTNKALRLDIGYSRIKKKSFNDRISYSGGDANLISFKCDFIIGELKTESIFTAYGLVGLGMHYTFVPAYTETYTSQIFGSDSTYTNTYNIEQEQKMNLILAIGGGLGIKLNKNLAVYTEIQYNSVTYGDFLFFVFGRGYIPVRLGLTYLMF